jgi:Mg-chelatase subunit ChlD
MKAVCGGLLFGLVVVASFAQEGRIEFAEPVKLVTCEPVSTVPCFRMKLNLVDGTGASSGVQIPASDRLASEMTVQVGDQPVKPFYAVASGETAATARRRAVLVIVDISGSMNHKMATGETRFQAAKRAIGVFLENFEEGADWVAVVPFESHHVQERISGAVFARTKAAALAQIEALPLPAPPNNTALYSAVVFGIAALQQTVPKIQAEAADTLDAMVIVLTDGVNEILRGDDLGLLAGPAGLQQAEQAVRTSGVPVVAIGFSDTGGLDESALQRISSKYYVTTDFEKLRKILAATRTLLNNRLIATFSSPFTDRASLAGQSLPIRVELKLPSGKILRSSQHVWSAPQMGVPVYLGRCSAAELKAAMVDHPPISGWTAIVRPLAVFCGLGLLLIVLWFWVPRLIWPEQYIGVMPGGTGAKWGSQTLVKDGVIVGRPAPPGFQGGPAGGNLPPRGVADKTIVNPSAYADFSRTRLGNRKNPQEKNIP